MRTLHCDKDHLIDQSAGKLCLLGRIVTYYREALNYDVLIVKFTCSTMSSASV